MEEHGSIRKIERIARIGSYVTDVASQTSYAEDGTPLRIFRIKQHITEQKHYEAELEKLQTVNEKKTDLPGIVAHDLRSPTAQIKGVTEILRDMVPDSEQSLLAMQDRAADAGLEMQQSSSSGPLPDEPKPFVPASHISRK